MRGNGERGGSKGLGGKWAETRRHKSNLRGLCIPFYRFFLFQSNPFGVLGRDRIGEMMSGIRFLVVVDSYAIALYPFSFPSPFPGGGEIGGRGVTRWGLFLMRGVNFFFLPKKKVCLFYTHSLFGPCLPD